MGKLSIEERAKRYDEALDRAKIWKVKSGMPKDKQGILDDIFPELKENDDERIRKELIDFIYDKTDTYELREKSNSWLAWLEKQGEQKLPIEKLPSEMKSIGESLGFTTQEECDRYNQMVTDLIMSDDDKGEQKPADKVEPKFRNGQWIVWQDKCYKVNYNGCGYELVDQNGLNTSLEYGTIDENAHLWTIQDAKDGDILVIESGRITLECLFIFKGIANREVLEYCYYRINDNTFSPTGSFIGYLDNVYHPATKEQRDLLFQKMKEAGYEWNAEKKELKKIEQKPNPYSGTSFEYNGHTYGMCARDNGVDILIDSKLKTHVSLDANQNHAWSEEDENAIHVLKDIVRHSDEIDEKIYTMSLKEKLYDWLKTLRGRYTCKPSDEQIHAFEQLYDWYNNNFAPSETLTSLYNDLKKLKGE